MVQVSELSPPQVVQAGPAALSPAIPEAALERLLRCNQIRELADDPAPVTIEDLARIWPWSAGMVRWAYQAGERADGPDASRVNRLAVVADVAAGVWLRLLLGRWRIWRVAPGAGGMVIRHLVYRRSRHHALPSSRLTTYVTCEPETPFIKSCLVLRAMRRYGACIEFLIRRLRSGLPAEETRRWLWYFLREAGDREAGPADSHREEPLETSGTRLAVPKPGTRLTYGVVMPTMFDSAVFRSSLLSLLRSDFPGPVVVVEDGHRAERACEAFCQRLPVTYVKNAAWTGPSGAMNAGIRRLDPDTDIALFAHSDALWPSRWFAQLDRAWETVFDSKKVSVLNLGYLQMHPKTDPALNELFCRGRFEELFWVLRVMRDVEPGIPYAEDLQNKDMGRLFGLARDNWGDQPGQLRMMTGKFSIGASFLMDAWRQLGGFDESLGFGFDMQLHYQSCLNRQWNLWVSNTPLIHLVSSDTGRLNAGERQRVSRIDRATYEGFARKYGWEVDHFFWTYFAELRVIYHDEIVEAANAGRFEDVDFVFDRLFEELSRKKLSSCELAWCRSRTACRYV